MCVAAVIHRVGLPTLDAAVRAQQRRRFVAIEGQVLAAHLGKLAARPHPRQRQRRVAPRAQRELGTRRHAAHERLHDRPRPRALEAVRVVEDEQEGRRLRKRRGDGGYDLLVHGRHGELQQLEQGGFDGRDRFERADQREEEDDGVVVGGVEGDPGAGAGICLAPLQQREALARARRRGHEHERSGRRGKSREKTTARDERQSGSWRAELGVERLDSQQVPVDGAGIGRDRTTARDARRSRAGRPASRSRSAPRSAHDAPFVGSTLLRT